LAVGIAARDAAFLGGELQGFLAIELLSGSHIKKAVSELR
jgi:hypothetical protein